MRLLNDAGAEYTYREYTEEPLSADEIRTTLGMLGVQPNDVLRTRDKAYKAMEWSGEESDDTIVERMAAHPTLLQRPIAVLETQAVLCRPANRVLELL